MPDYALTAANCPAPQTPLSALYAGATPPSPVVGTALATGPAGAGGLVTLINADQVRGNLLGRYGGGGYAVWHGLELTDGGGLEVDISTGQAGIDGPAEVRVATSLALTDNVTNRVWISRAGVLNKVTSASGTPLAPPDASTQWVFLGAVVTSGGAITSIDYSGRIQQDQGGVLWRRTADNGVPGDTPPSTVRLFTRTKSGLYFWDGVEYFRVRKPGKLTKALSDANTTLTDAEALYEVLTFTGTLSTGRDVVLPNWDGEQRTVKNGADQTLTFKVSGQTGVAVATGKKAILLCNGTDYERVTADA